MSMAGGGNLWSVSTTITEIHYADLDGRCVHCETLWPCAKWVDDREEYDQSVVRADETQGDTDDRGHMPTR